MSEPYVVVSGMKVSFKCLNMWLNSIVSFYVDYVAFVRDETHVKV